ncbi:MAG: hypothetical protein HY314_11675 [Acidobacteria bacterium]|nr:hypothetical protein [Acidobacteriota bacterium]
MKMSLFDKMFGSGASEAEKQPQAQKRFEELKQKYQSVLRLIEQQIFNANRDKLVDPNIIKAGQELTIPPANP